MPRASLTRFPNGINVVLGIQLFLAKLPLLWACFTNKGSDFSVGQTRAKKVMFRMELMTACSFI